MPASPLGITNVDRIGPNPNLPGHLCIPTSGWYTFKHTLPLITGLSIVAGFAPDAGESCFQLAGM